MYIPSLSLAKDNRPANESERIGKLKRISLFKNAHKELQVEKFDKGKHLLNNSFLSSSDCFQTNSEADSKVFLSKKSRSNNERKTIALNNMENRLLTLKSRNIDRQMDSCQQKLKRDRAALLDQYLETKVANYQYLRDRNTNMTTEPMIMGRDTTFRFANINSVSSTSISEKFVEQKRKYFPNYKRKRDKKINWNLISGDFESPSDLQNSSRASMPSNRSICSKFGNHIMAQYKADYFSDNKILIREFPYLFNRSINSAGVEVLKL